MARDDHNGRKWAIGTLLAATIGFLAGILTAPKSGKENREDVKRVTTKAIRDAEKQLKSAHTELQTLIASGSQKLKTGGRVVRKDFDLAVNRAKNAQRGVKEILSALHDGTASNPELTKALKEASAAKAHLKKYLSGALAKDK